MESIWTQNIQRRAFEPLRGDIKTDVLIIGGGITGLLCAYRLKEAGVSCVLVEADRICGGVTANTTAKITVQHGLIYDKIIRKYGVEAALMYLKAQQAALAEFETLCKGIACDYQTQDAYVYSVNHRRAIEREARAYEQLGLSARLLEQVDLPLKVTGALCLKDQAQFHPLKFCLSLAETLPIYEQTKVLEFFQGGVITNHGKILAQKIIVATHFPMLNKHGGYFLKMYQHRSYVLALENVLAPSGMYVDESDKGLSFRSYNGALLLGGGGHRTGKKGGNWQELTTFAQKNYTGYREMARFATQDCITLDSIPYIGQYSTATPHLYVATGFNKWGMTSSMAAAMILCDQIQGHIHPLARVFSPARSMWHGQLALNAAETTVGLLRPTAPRCPHLGCALVYNAAEHSWDCPCHGSRFTEEGKLIENPATDDIKP